MKLQRKCAHTHKHSIRFWNEIFDALMMYIFMWLLIWQTMAMKHLISRVWTKYYSIPFFVSTYWRTRLAQLTWKKKHIVKIYVYKKSRSVNYSYANLKQSTRQLDATNVCVCMHIGVFSSVSMAYILNLFAHSNRSYSSVFFSL